MILRSKIDLEDFKDELRQLKERMVRPEYIMDYWDQYTMALTM